MVRLGEGPLALVVLGEMGRPRGSPLVQALSQ